MSMLPIYNRGLATAVQANEQLNFHLGFAGKK